MTHDPFESIKMRQIDLEAFLSMVPEEALEDGQTLYGFTTQIHECAILFSDDPTQDPTYARRHLLLVKGSTGYNEEQVYLQNLLLQARHANLWKAPMDEMMHEIAMKHLEVFGQPKYLVEVHPGLWFVGNPQDFRKVRSDRGIGLACHYEVRTLVFSMLSYTSAEADAMIASMGKRP